MQHDADRVGRRLALAVGVVITCGGIFGELFSTARAAFLISKLILGVGLGFYLTIGPLYSSEASYVQYHDLRIMSLTRSQQVSPVVLRGITTAGVNLGIVIGQLLSNAAIRGFGERGDKWAYRGPFAIQFFFVGMFSGVY